MSTAVTHPRMPESVTGGRRRDIQAMRGVAVLLVVFYHGGFGAPIAGFLGVDIFFVISGFLITGNILRDLNGDRFSFADFYWRRARRILPAAYAVLLIVFFVSCVLLAPTDFQAFQSQLVGALAFAANIALWRQSGYFDGVAESKPLLHMWSLSIEEQFYFFVPIVLWLTPRRFRFALLMTSLAVSLMLCLALSTTRPSLAFYMLPTRAWELLFGAAAAAWLRAETFGSFRSAIGWIATVVLLVIPFFPIDSVHPRADAVLVCLASILVIGSRPAILERGVLGEVLARVGDVSYSLYLIHWPLFAFLHVVHLGDASWTLRAAIIVVSLVASVALHKFVETPFRRLERPMLPRLAVMVGSAIALAAVPATALFVNHHESDWARLGAPNKGLAASCDFDAEGAFVLRQECATSASPSILVWGDSFAMHLAPGLAANDNGLGIVQATKSACGPILGLALLNDRHPASWAQSCISFNNSVFKFLGETASIRYVVLSSPFGYFTEGSAGSLLTASGRGNPSLDNASAALRATVQKIMAVGKKVVLVAPPPFNSRFDSFHCVERASMKLFTTGAPKDCKIDLPKFQTADASVSEMLSRMEAQLGAYVVRPQSELCDEKDCATQINGMPIYRDAGHLSYEGSKIVFDRLAASGKLQFMETKGGVAKTSFGAR